MPDQPPTVALALQGGGSHGAFTWGVLDRLLLEVAAGRLRISAVSGASAGALNAALTVSGLVQGGAELARRKLEEFWRSLSRRGFLDGNSLFFNEPGLFGFNLDWSPVAIALEAMGLVVSPYTNPFYTDALAPLVAQAFPAAELAALNAAATPRLFVTATDVTSNGRAIFTQPDISTATLRASAALPTDFKAVTIGGVPYWDGGYLGNPSLSPLLDHAQDLLLVLVNPFHRDGMPPRSAPAIMDRLNEITFNASVVLEVNAIEAINTLLAELARDNVPYTGRYKPIHLHAIRNDKFNEQLGFVSKSSTSWTLLSALHDAGYQTADAWLDAHRDDLGARSSLDVKADLIDKVLNAPVPAASAT
ncbi:patatin-like phospholipase family protein [Rhodopila globiformis]|uniref:Patatin n=1 Tax=Rhodopila globiformis TaxID=1071 RepID=A0A2S6NNV8_RHOGL|nr:patatin-like phospholipase family protein [Rhodopila globiformis]PPQ39508.1 patatin [Rhodopila globiformis]